MANKKTEVERVHEYLLSIGAKEITAEEKKTEWYKKEMNTLNCPFTHKEFEKLCD
jgi:hypothetical protein